MNYNIVIERLNEIINSKLTMESLMEIRGLYIISKYIYSQELAIANNRNNCTIKYEKHIIDMNQLILNKLKSELMVDEFTINKIFTTIRDGFEYADDIYILNDIDNKFIITKNATDKQTLSLSWSNGFKDITSNDFNVNNEDAYFTKLIAGSLNNSIKTLIQNGVEPDDILEINGNKVNYVLPELNIYANRNFNDIIINDNGTKITKILVIYQNQMLYFDMKIYHGYVILSQNDIEITKLSEELRQKTK